MITAAKSVWSWKSSMTHDVTFLSAGTNWLWLLSKRDSFMWMMINMLQTEWILTYKCVKVAFAISISTTKHVLVCKTDVRVSAFPLNTAGELAETWQCNQKWVQGGLNCGAAEKKQFTKKMTWGPDYHYVCSPITWVCFVWFSNCLRGP